MTFTAGIAAVFDMLPFGREGFAPTEGAPTFGASLYREDLFQGHGVLNFSLREMPLRVDSWISSTSKLFLLYT